MSIVTLPELKAHLNIVDDADDVLLQQKLDSAESYIAAATGYTVDADLPAALREAILRLAADYFENRESAIIGDQVRVLPHGVDEIVRQFRSWSF